MPEGIPADVPTEIPAILGAIVMGLLGMLGWMVRHVTSGDGAKIDARLTAVEGAVQAQALALKDEAVERRLADQKLVSRVQGLGKEIRTIHDIVEDAK